jgi:hypothetical protein
MPFIIIFITLYFYEKYKHTIVDIAFLFYDFLPEQDFLFLLDIINRAVKNHFKIT